VALRAGGNSEFLDSVVTCVETWVHYFTPESKRTSKQCKHTCSSPPLPKKKRNQFFSARKIMATVFWGSKGIIHLDLPGASSGWRMGEPLTWDYPHVRAAPNILNKEPWTMG
jgi:hypothetical protein